MVKNIFIVFNPDGEVMGVFYKEEKAKDHVKTIGEDEWEEEWWYEGHTVNHIKEWLYKRED